ncbi:hypothetical protein V8C42DRAFT_318795 [Trichoderma barbatum]
MQSNSTVILLIAASPLHDATLVHLLTTHAVKLHLDNIYGTPAKVQVADASHFGALAVRGPSVQLIESPHMQLQRLGTQHRV